MLDSLFEGIFDSELTAVISVSDFVLCLCVSLVIGIIMAFAYMLYKTDNILVSTGFHTLHNGIMIALQFLLMYFL